MGHCSAWGHRFPARSGWPLTSQKAGTNVADRDKAGDEIARAWAGLTPAEKQKIGLKANYFGRSTRAFTALKAEGQACCGCLFSDCCGNTSCHCSWGAAKPPFKGHRPRRKAGQSSLGIRSLVSFTNARSRRDLTHDRPVPHIDIPAVCQKTVTRCQVASSLSNLGVTVTM